MEALPAVILADRISFLVANMAVRCNQDSYSIGVCHDVRFVYWNIWGKGGILPPSSDILPPA
jgi:hypothetical protein